MSQLNDLSSGNFSSPAAATAQMPSQTQMASPSANFPNSAASAVPSAAPSMPMKSSPSPAVAPVSSPAVPSEPAASPASSSQESVEELLKRLESLSQEIEKEEAKKTPDVVATPAPVSEPAPSMAPLASEPVNSPVMNNNPVVPVSSIPEKGKTEEDFDLDAFLADLEKRIEQSEKDSHSAPASQNSAGFSTATPTQSPTAMPAATSVPANEAKRAEEPVMASQPATPSFSEDQKPEEDFRKNRSSFQEENTDSPYAGVLQNTASSPSLMAPVEPASLAAPEEKQLADKVLAETTMPTPDGSEVEAEDLAAQNIFELLGIEATDAEKEQFLTELEDLILQDFVEKDLPLLFTTEEYQEVKTMMGSDFTKDEAAKEKVLEFVYQKIPSLEKILFDKALHLKEQMMMERLRQLENSTPEVKQKITEIRSSIQENKWKKATELLQQLPKN